MYTTSGSSFVVRSSGAPRLDVFGVSAAPVVGAAESAGSASIAHLRCPPGAGSPLHRHEQSENFYVLRGTLTALVDGDTHALEAGDFVHVAPGVTHAFQNRTAEDVEFLAIGTPAGHEVFFREADELARSGRFNPETAGELCARNGIELVG